MEKTNQSEYIDQMSYTDEREFVRDVRPESGFPFSDGFFREDEDVNDALLLEEELP